MARVLTVLTLAMLLGGPAFAAQTVYRWVDERGGVHYTGFLHEVPEQYRSQVTGTSMPSTAPASAPPAARPPGGKGSGKWRLEFPSGGSGGVHDQATCQQLAEQSKRAGRMAACVPDE
jgi:hypothetical protein